MSPEDLRRFLLKIEVSETGCWEWTAGKNARGYGTFYLEGQTRAAHRVAYQMVNGDLSSELMILHACDNPPCVRPSHLSQGTHIDNVRERQMRNREPQGSMKPGAKLSEQAVRECRQRHLSGETVKSLADEYSVNRSTMSRAVRGIKWKVVS